jgi:two-component system, chemotaxis family, protein-glutamate methylesterase/glutaminase
MTMGGGGIRLTILPIGRGRLKVQPIVPTITEPCMASMSTLPRQSGPEAGGGPAYDLVVMAASAGGFSALTQILGGLPADFGAAVVVVQHRSTREPNLLVPLLARRSPLRVTAVTEGEGLRPGVVYIAPPDLHAVVRPDHRLALTDGRKISFVRSSANPLFASAAAALGNRVIAVVLTGSGCDGTDGVQAIRTAGGLVIVQNPATAAHASMPLAAIRSGAVDYVLPGS